MKFSDLKLNPQLLRAIEEKGYTEPSPIQVSAIPMVLSGQDVIGIAQTGTGKTAAFVLPILRMLNYAQGEDPRCIIIAPTRELAIQIDEEIKSFCTHTDLRHALVYGGTGIKGQIEKIKTGVDIITATPGRLLDINKAHGVNLKQVKIMVIDEADKMMDMGFRPQINRILELVPMKKQNLMFSATLSERVEKLAEGFLEFPQRVEVTPQATPAETVSQLLYEAPNLKSKIKLLEYLLQGEFSEDKILIFTKTKKNADDVFKFIERKIGISVKVIHANKSQNTRLNSIQAFRDDEVQILVATDVSSRGLDISDVVLVINFDVPLIYEDYVHRIGRTGRANKKGASITFANEAEMWHIEAIEKMIGMPIPRKPWPKAVDRSDATFEEKQAIALEIDHLKRKANPDFKGAFHETTNKHKLAAQNASRIRKKKKKR